MQGVEKLASTIDGMIANIEKLGKQELGTELTNWQVEDMHRKYPNTDAADNTASTEIWPRSRASQRYVPRQGPRQRRRVLITKPRMRQGRIISVRPILRPELYQKLVERFTALLEKLTWASASHP
jgi:hypothetical protein